MDHSIEICFQEGRGSGSHMAEPTSKPARPRRTALLSLPPRARASEAPGEQTTAWRRDTVCSARELEGAGDKPQKGFFLCPAQLRLGTCLGRVLVLSGLSRSLLAPCP